jgi:septal ring factor EnvC (AmiA/AmiB activator)
MHSSGVSRLAVRKIASVTIAAALIAVQIPSFVPFARAEDAPPAMPADVPSEADRQARQADLDAVTRDIALTNQRQAELQKEIDGLDKDRATLNQTLLDTGKRVQDMEAAIDASEAKLKSLADSEATIHRSLLERRDVLAEVLAALQRMGRHPPPALLVRPEDALSSVRSAILLGAVVPDLRLAAAKLADDLKKLVALKTEIAAERDRLRADATRLLEDRTRVQLLVEEKRNQASASAAELADEQRKAAALADKATSLKDLIARMEAQIAAAAETSAAAEKAAAEAAAKAAAAPPAKPTSLGSAGRLAPAVAFNDAKGLLPKPVSGSVVAGFGDKDSLGGRSQGISIATRASAQVTSPCDGWVVYAGPFRSYGQLLIINAGGGYHVLLAGMERIDVQLGQFILAGEPVAMMASQRLASAGATPVAAAQPVLYVEFRKEGTSIDPAPWWATSSDEKVGG